MAKTKTSPSVDALKPYVQRAMTDPELREDLLAAFVAARSLYGQMAKGQGVKGKAEKVSEKDFQKQLQHLVNDLSEASDKLQGKAQSKGHKVRNRVILLTGVTLGVLYNPWTGQSTRDWIMEKVAGGDDSLDEFADSIGAGVDTATNSAKAAADAASDSLNDAKASAKTAASAAGDALDSAKDGAKAAVDAAGSTAGDKTSKA